MSAIFDTLEYTKGAEAIGIKREHAEYQANKLAKLIDDQLVTKSYLANELIKLEMRLTIKLGGLMIVCSTIIIGVLGFLIKT